MTAGVGVAGGGRVAVGGKGVGLVGVGGAVTVGVGVVHPTREKMIPKKISVMLPRKMRAIPPLGDLGAVGRITGRAVSILLLIGVRWGFDRLQGRESRLTDG